MADLKFYDSFLEHVVAKDDDTLKVTLTSGLFGGPIIQEHNGWRVEFTPGVASVMPVFKYMLGPQCAVCGECEWEFVADHMVCRHCNKGEK